MFKYKYNVNTPSIEFNWDEAKNIRNIRKHGVSFEEASGAFMDEDGLVIDDPDHSFDEQRFILLGSDAKLRVLVVCHVYRQDDRMIRIISARRASQKERDQYWRRRRR